MLLAPMRFKDYVWPHNPRIYEIGFRRDIVSHRVPFGRYILQNMGRGNRIFRGEGEFTGPGAYREFGKLGNLFYDASPGQLVHPLWMSTSAWLVALELREEPLADYVKYSFEFWECSQPYDLELKPVGTAATVQAAGPNTYTVRAGDTLSDIAWRYSLSLAELLDMNPSIKNPNFIVPGQVISLGAGAAL